MRFALILALAIAVLAVVFALQNPAETTLNLGPYAVTGSTAIVVLVTFALGALTGILAAIPGRWRATRRARQLEKQVHGGGAPAASPSLPPASEPASKPSTSGEPDPYTARFGPPPHQV